MNILVVIPARWQSTRFPGKPMAMICGKPMIQHVAENAISAMGPKKVIVATDDKQIERFCKSISVQVEMTSKDHETGTDRIAEVARKHEADIYINMQGDEPLIDYRTVHRMCYAKISHMHEVICGMSRIMMTEDENDHHMVKIVKHNGNKCVYMSREPISDEFKQAGIYAMTGEELQLFAETPVGTDGNEGIELLRFLDVGKTIAMVEAPPGIMAVDIHDHLIRVEKLMKKDRIEELCE